MAPNIILIVIDTARADALSCYSDNVQFTPNLDRFAQSGVLFKNAFATAPWTLPVHASMFTGLYPSEHGANQSNLRLGPDSPTLAEKLGQSGYSTLGLSSNAWLTRAHGMDRGFDTFLESEAFQPSMVKRILNRASGLRLSREGLFARRTQRVFDTALDLVERARSPYFLFINLMDAHLPYLPLPAHRHFVQAQYRDRMWSVNQDAARYLSGACEMEPSDFEILQGMYQGEVAGVDVALSGFMEELSALESKSDPVLILTSDHGENVGEHGLMDHQLCLYDSLLHVPLIVHGPGKIPKRLVVNDLVSLHSLFGTICELGEVEEASATESAGSLCALWNEPSAAEGMQHIFAEMSYPEMYLDRLRRYNPEADLQEWSTSQKCIRSSRHKYIVYGDGRRALFDLDADPGETRDVSAMQVDVVSDLEHKLADWESTLKVASSGERLVHDDLDSSVRDRLEALGYL